MNMDITEGSTLHSTDVQDILGRNRQAVLKNGNFQRRLLLGENIPDDPLLGDYLAQFGPVHQLAVDLFGHYCFQVNMDGGCFQFW